MAKITKKRIFEFIEKNRLMSLATSSNNKPWSATVFFVYDKKFNVYFYSKPSTKHCKNISKNANISLTISHYWGKDGEISGIQYVGKAEILKGQEEEKAYKLYKDRYAWADDFRGDHKMYKITPVEVWMIDSEITGHTDRIRFL